MSATRIDDRIVRVDAMEKARGEAEYVCDIRFPGMVYGTLVRSTVARGKILSIDVPALPEGYSFITADDIPAEGRNELWMIAKDWRCFASGDVRYVGETIGILCGPDRGMLSYLKKHIAISYEECLVLS